MTDTVETKDIEVKSSNMETHSALPPEETERLARRNRGGAEDRIRSGNSGRYL